MLAKRIILCLNVTGGRVVKGVNNCDGADELVFLDITAGKVFIPLTVGGGILAC